MLDSRNAQFGHPVKKKTTFGIFVKITKSDIPSLFCPYIFLQDDFRMRFIPLESRLQGLQFEHKFDLIWSPDGE